MDSIGWIIAVIVFVVLELMTLGLTNVWFAVGALAAFVAALLEAPLAVQFIVFIIVSGLVLVFVRPFAVKYINNNPEKTNVESMAGKTGKVLVRVNNIEGQGTISVDGLEWTARTEDNSTLDVDELVTVIRIEGVKAIVKKKSN